MAYPQFQWDSYTPEECQNLKGWLFDNRGNTNLIEEVADDPWVRLLSVLRTGTHSPRPKTATELRQRQRRRDDQEVNEILSRYRVQETSNGAFGNVVLVGRPGLRAFKLGRHSVQREGKKGTAYTGVYNTVLAIIEDNPDRSWSPYHVAKALDGLGANRGIRNPEARARGILQELAARGFLVQDGGRFQALGEDRMAVLSSERMIPQTVGGIMAAHATDSSHLDTNGNVRFTTDEIGAELRVGGFVQNHDGMTRQDYHDVAQRALERLRREFRAVNYDPANDTWTMTPSKARRMPAITLELA